MTTNTQNIDVIVTAIVKRVLMNLELDHDVSLSDVAATEIYNFLITRVQSGVRVVFKNDVSNEDENFARTTVVEGDYQVSLAYGENGRPDKYPYVLFVSVSKTPEYKFREFWRNRHLPASLLDDAMRRVRFTKPIEITVFESAGRWNRQRMEDSEKGELRVFGQHINEKTGSFIPSRPIGYVTQFNQLVITNPNEKFEFGGEHYIFE